MCEIFCVACIHAPLVFCNMHATGPWPISRGAHRRFSIAFWLCTVAVHVLFFVMMACMLTTGPVCIKEIGCTTRLA